MQLAIFSDIHANLEALEVAADYAKTRHIDRYTLLGDTIGYGADPNECLTWALEHAQIHLMGNHEKGVLDPSLEEWFDPRAWEALKWTARALDEDLKKRIRDLSYVRIEKEMSFAHGSLHEPEEFHYLRRFVDARPSFAVMETPVCFVGHTHVPSCFFEKEGAAAYLPEGIIPLKEGERCILNPGSVGQPREADKRLSFGIYDDAARTFEIVRLAYDSQKAAEKILRAGLPRIFADRLLS